MAMQVSGNYAQSRTDYAEKVKEKPQGMNFGK